MEHTINGEQIAKAPFAALKSVAIALKINPIGKNVATLQGLVLSEMKKQSKADFATDEKGRIKSVEAYAAEKKAEVKKEKVKKAPKEKQPKKDGVQKKIFEYMENGAIPVVVFKPKGTEPNINEFNVYSAVTMLNRFKKSKK